MDSELRKTAALVNNTKEELVLRTACIPPLRFRLIFTRIRSMKCVQTVSKNVLCWDMISEEERQMLPGRKTRPDSSKKDVKTVTVGG